MAISNEDLQKIEIAVADRDRQRAEFVGTISHDLKNPLNAIVGFTSVLLADSAGFGAEQVRQLRLVKDSARSMLGRIDALLEFHRIEAGKIEAKPDWFMPAEILIQLVESRRECARERGVELKLQMKDGLDRVLSDARLVRRVLDELLANAIRFSGGGEVVLSIDIAPPDPDAGRRLVRIGVTDAGPGLSDEHRDQLVRSLDPSRGKVERSYKGLGLGLALAREAARLLGGRVELASPPGEGAHFRLVLDLPRQDVKQS